LAAEFFFAARLGDALRIPIVKYVWR
jgi:hypothetical protein